MGVLVSPLSVWQVTSASIQGWDDIKIATRLYFRQLLENHLMLQDCWEGQNSKKTEGALLVFVKSRMFSGL